MRGAFAEKRRQVSRARRRQAGSSTVRGTLSRSRAIIPPTPCGTGLKRPFALGGKAGASLCEPCGTGRRREQRSALQVRSAGGRRSKSERRETAVTAAGSRLPGHGLRVQVRHEQMLARRGRDAMDCPERMGARLPPEGTAGTSRNGPDGGAAACRWLWRDQSRWNAARGGLACLAGGPPGFACIALEGSAERREPGRKSAVKAFCKAWARGRADGAGCLTAAGAVGLP